MFFYDGKFAFLRTFGSDYDRYKDMYDAMVPDNVSVSKRTTDLDVVSADLISISEEVDNMIENDRYTASMLKQKLETAKTTHEKLIAEIESELTAVN